MNLAGQRRTSYNYSLTTHKCLMLSLLINWSQGHVDHVYTIHSFYTPIHLIQFTYFLYLLNRHNHKNFTLIIEHVRGQDKNNPNRQTDVYMYTLKKSFYSCTIAIILKKLWTLYPKMIWKFSKPLSDRHILKWFNEPNEGILLPIITGNNNQIIKCFFKQPMKLEKEVKGKGHLPYWTCVHTLSVNKILIILVLYLLKHNSWCLVCLRIIISISCILLHSF